MLRGSRCLLLGILPFYFKLFNLASISASIHIYVLEVLGIAVVFYFPDSEAWEDVKLWGHEYVMIEGLLEDLAV